MISRAILPGLLVTFMLAGMLLAPGCIQESPSAAEPSETPAGNGLTVTASSQAGVLTAEEAVDILYMREEEKLARDVYFALYDRWHEQVFANIGSAEETHMQSLLVLVERYGLTDSSTGVAGTFSNETLQAAYSDLTTQGSVSLADAYRTGAYIEELDIADLQAAMDHTQNQDIVIVYERLMDGSFNHLRAFASHLDALGKPYTPVVISRQEYDLIISGK